MFYIKSLLNNSRKRYLGRLGKEETKRDYQSLEPDSPLLYAWCLQLTKNKMSIKCILILQ